MNENDKNKAYILYTLHTFYLLSTVRISHFQQCLNYPPYFTDLAKLSCYRWKDKTCLYSSAAIAFDIT